MRESQEAAMGRAAGSGKRAADSGQCYHRAESMIRLGSLLICASLAAPLEARNVILLTVDSCRPDRFGVYGGPAANTPNIDRWAGSGAVFENAYSTAAWTAPGLVSVLTGLYPPAHGVNNRDQVGSTATPSLLKLFSARGYTVPNLTMFSFVPYFSNLGLGPPPAAHFAPREPDTLLNWLRSTDARTPFFVWFHTTLLHLPYNLGAAEARPDGELSPGIEAVLRATIVPRNSVEFTPADRGPLLALYDAEVRLLDDFVGRLIDTLQDLELFEETLVVLTADHGEELLEHGFVGHASTSLQARLYEEHVRIPLIVSGTDGVGEGVRIERPVSQIDVAPTILQLAGLKIPAVMQGQSLFAEPVESRSLFMESVIAGNLTGAGQQNSWVRAVRRDNLKYISSGELYDLARDPGETTNLAEAQPETARRLQSEIDDWLSASLRLRARGSDGPAAAAAPCPVISSPTSGSRLRFGSRTGAVRVSWSGRLDNRYQVQYRIGEGVYRVEGVYEILGNNHLLGPYSKQIWDSLSDWNPFRFRVAAAGPQACWSEWVSFEF